MSVPTIDLTDCPITYERATEILGERPVGFKAITESGPTCHEGCLARGSSPHSHSTVIEWMLVGSNSIAWVDVKSDLVVRAAVLHKFKES